MRLRPWARALWSVVMQGMFQMEREMCWSLVQPAPHLHLPHLHHPPPAGVKHLLASLIPPIHISWLWYLGLSNRPPTSTRLICVTPTPIGIDLLDSHIS